MKQELKEAELENLEDEAPPSDIDSDSEAEEEEEESDDEPKMPKPAYEMYYVENSVEFLDASWGKFSFFFGLYYVMQFGLALCAANMYAHTEKNVPCVIDGYDLEEG